jgi:hypothetical protein
LPKVYLNLRKSVEIVKGDLQVCKFQVYAWAGFCIKTICYYTAGGTPWPPPPLCSIQVVQVWAMLLNPSIQLSLMFMGLVTSFPWINFSCYVLDEGTMLSCSADMKEGLLQHQGLYAQTRMMRSWAILASLLSQM